MGELLRDRNSAHGMPHLQVKLAGCPQISHFAIGSSRYVLQEADTALLLSRERRNHQHSYKAFQNAFETYPLHYLCLQRLVLFSRMSY